MLHSFLIANPKGGHLIPTLLREVPLSEWPSRIEDREAIRIKPVTRVLEVISQTDWPVVVLCDCNFMETSAAYARFDDRLDDSFREDGWGMGHTIRLMGTPLSLNRIDYVWHSGHFTALHSWVVREGTSDHFPVVVDLLLVE